MNFEIVDNIFQILVLFCVMIASAVTACKKKSRDFLLLAGSNGCFMMGTLYAAEALSQRDKGGRKYNRAFRKGIFK